jgi:hypothetical protein
MDLARLNDSNAQFLAYVEGLTSVIGHADRTKPLQAHDVTAVPALMHAIDCDPEQMLGSQGVRQRHNRIPPTTTALRNAGARLSVWL